MMWFREVQRPCAEALWGRAMASLPDPEVAFGPRWRERPRPGERTWAVVDDRGKLLGVGSLESAGPGAVSYCVCLLPEARGCGARLRVREYLVDVYGTRELLYRYPEISSFVPIPLRPRRRRRPRSSSRCHPAISAT